MSPYLLLFSTEVSDVRRSSLGADPRDRDHGRDLRGAAKALREFGDLALWVVPIHGLFVPNNDEVSTVVDRVAQQSLDLGEARRAFKEALSVVEEFAHRDPIESGHNRVRAASEEAYFYAGLAFGLTFADFRSMGTR